MNHAKSQIENRMFSLNYIHRHLHYGSLSLKV